MKFLGHILSHLGFIIVLGLVVAVLYFRADLFSDEINKPVDRALASLEAKFDIELPRHKPTMETPLFVFEAKKPEVKTYPQDTTTAEPAITQDQEDVYPQAAVTEEEPRDKSEDMMTVVEKIKETVASTVDEMIEAVETDSAKEETVAAVEASVAQPEPQAVTASNSASILHQARQAYWNGNLPAAEKAYQELSQINKSDPNVYGELGNIYYAQGKWKQAGEAYYEAAVRLIELRQPAQVNYLLRVIQGLDAESAAKLRQKMTG